MRILLLIGVGSFVGGVARYLLSQWITSTINSTFPFSTLLVNFIGCFVIGLVYGVGEKAQLPLELRLFFMAGICGGFTTFSAFGLETVNLLTSGQNLYALVYTVASLALGVAATFAGIWLSR